jgi:tetratricopeptide (TPR) repeat protein
LYSQEKGTIDTMVFGHIISSPRGNLSLQQSLLLANLFLDCAGRAQDRDVAIVLCHETEAALSHAKKAAKNVEDKALQQEIGHAYIGLGQVLESQEHRDEAQAIYKKAEKLG